MAVREIIEGIYEVGAIHWDRTVFDELVHIPDGTSYNSYLIKDEKTVLIDTVDPEKKDVLFENLEILGIDRIDYIISNHAEQDHSGSIPFVLEKYPEAKVITNPKCKDFLIDLLHIPEDKFIEVSDGEEFKIGKKTLKFIYTPWVHWPETMTTYLIEDKILFSGDFFGSHRAASHLFVKDEYKVIEDAKRYYAEIMMPFRTQIQNNLKKLENLEIRYIAPTHGPVYNNPEIIINAYKEWVSPKCSNKVLIPYVSMHGSTKVMVDYVVDRLTEAGIEVIPINLTKMDIGVLTMNLIDATTIVFASPYVLAGYHPAIVYAVYLVNALRPKTRFIGIMGSYGWGGKGPDQLKSMLYALNVEYLKTVMIKGLPREDDFRLLDELVEEIKKRH